MKILISFLQVLYCAFIVSILVGNSSLVAAATSSPNYSITTLQQNNGSGSRLSPNYQISRDQLSQQPLGTASSPNYSLRAGSLPVQDLGVTGALYINNNADITGSITVALNLICSAASGCAEFSLSNNGVSWSTPAAYITSTSWELPAIDGERSVYVKYKNGNGDWSGVFSDSITLDATAPQLSLSPVGGIFMSNQTITVTASEGADIFCTIDGSIPTTASDPYPSEGISLTDDKVIKCMARDTADNKGSIVTESYQICGGSNMSISGTVTDVTVGLGMPLTIITLNNGDTADTTEDGAYSFGPLPSGYYSIVSITTPNVGFVSYQQELMLCESSLTHPIDLTLNSTTFGSDTSSGYSADSVNTSTGNYTYATSDIAIPGRGMPFSFDRTYNSQDTKTGVLGYGWTHDYNISLEVDADANIIVRWGDGKVEVWAEDGSSGYTPMYGVFSTLIKNGDNSFTLRQKNMLEYQFDINNKLASIADENGNSLLFSYSGNNLSSVTDTVGRVISLSYDASNRITRILDPTDRSVTYAYDVNGDMVSFTDLGGETTTYAYNANHQMMSVVDPKGVAVMSLVYDEQRKVVSSQKDAMGSETLYSYDTAKKATQIVDPYGNTSYHHFDSLLRLTKEVDALGNEASYVYTEQGNIDNVTDKNGNLTSFTYDASGNVLQKTEPLGKTSSATYNTQSNPLTKTDALGNVTSFTYDAKENLLTTTNALSNSTSFTWDQYGQMLTKTDTLGSTTSWEYDHLGNNVAVTDALGNRSTFIYDAVGRQVRESHPSNRATAYEYDDMDRIISITDGMGRSSQFVFDANANKTEHINSRGNKTLFVYDAKDRLINKTTALGNTEHYTYDLLDRRSEVRNAMGAVSKVKYDAMGQVAQEIDSLGNVVSHSYDANGNRIRSTDALGNSSTAVFDGLNRLLSTTDAQGNTTTTTTYDLNGNVLSVTDAQGHVVSSSYDALNRLKTITDPLGNVSGNDYDELGRLILVTNAKNNQTGFEYDVLGRTVKVTDAEGGEVSAAYDAFGNRTSMTDTLGHTTTYTFDILNRILSGTDALGNAEVLTYDQLGNVATMSDSHGTTGYSYDLGNRLTSISFPDATGVSYSYDAVGKRVSITDITGTTSYQYNQADQILQVTDPFGMKVGYTYDPNGNRTSTKYPGNKSVYYSFDSLGHMTKVQDWAGIATNYQYDTVGRLTNKTLGNGATVSFSYDNGGRLTNKTDRTPGGAVIASYDYTLDQLGNRTGMEMEQPIQPRLDFTDDYFNHNAGNQVISGAGRSYSYDGNGNRINDTDGSQTSIYDYNFDDLLTRVEKGSKIQEYRYNSSGQRLASINDGVETRYLLDTNGDMEYTLATMDAANSIKSYHIYGDGLLSTIDADTGEHLFFHYDALGNTVAVSDMAGNITDSYAYLPFGEMTSSETSHDNPFTYVGQYGVMQESNGLYFMRARFYDPMSKRFIGKDPVKGEIGNSQTLSPYSYAEGMPTIGIDPTGESLTLALLAYVGVKALYVATTVYVFEHSLAGDAIDGAVTAASGQSQIDPVEEGVKAFVPGGRIANWILDIPEMIGNNFGFAENNYDGPMALMLKSMENQPSMFDNLESPMPGVGEGIANNQETGPTAEQFTPFDGSGWSAVTSNTAATDQPKVQEQIVKPPRRYLNVGRYAGNHFSQQFGKLLTPGFLDQQTRSYIEMSMQRSIYSLQADPRRYSYRSKKRKEKAKAAMYRDIQQSSSRLYAQLTSALSKHSVLIQSLERLPGFSHGNGGRGGVYAAQ